VNGHPNLYASEVLLRLVTMTMLLILYSMHHYACYDVLIGLYIVIYYISHIQDKSKRHSEFPADSLITRISFGNVQSL